METKWCCIRAGEDLASNDLQFLELFGLEY